MKTVSVQDQAVGIEAHIPEGERLSADGGRPRGRLNGTLEAADVSAPAPLDGVACASAPEEAGLACNFRFRSAL